MNMKIEITQNLTKPSTPVFYGTAGYRSNTNDLIKIISRASFIAYLRSCSFAGKRIGIMITASHNSIDYNGIKFIDHNGNMLDKIWEKCSDELVNCEDKDFYNLLNKILRNNSNLSDIHDGIIGHVVIGRDSRESGIEICESIKNVLGQVNCVIEEYGEVSTPEMHYLIRQSNLKSKLVSKSVYKEHLVEKYNKLKQLTNNDMSVLVDTANGVISKIIKENFEMNIINEDLGILNYKCGADFVKTYSKLPEINFDFKNEKTDTVYASFDGDADRLILFKNQDELLLIDGDVQAYLLANYFQKLLTAANLNLKIGVILSFYSNGGVFEALKNFKTEMVQAGVKNFIKAAKNYNIGVYFEPNGHGSVLFSDSAKSKFKSGKSTEHKILELLSVLFDPCIGDGLANLLIYKSLFTSKEICKNFSNNGSRLLPVKVKNKNKIVVDNQNNVITPKDLQKLINDEVLKVNGRAFVRPSGTEDVVRVYAEAKDQREADVLCLKVAQLVYDMCEGVGYHPEIDYSK